MKTLFMYSLFTFSSSLFTLSAQSWLWGKQGVGLGEGYSVATNSKGDAFLTGYFYDTLKFGSYTLNAYHNAEAFLVKYDNQGNLKWAIQSLPYSNTGGNVYSLSVTADKKGNSYITGYFGDTIKFGSYTLACLATSNVFIAKIDSNGNIAWLEQGVITSSQNHNSGYAISTDNSNNVYITGSFDNTITFGTITLRLITGGSDFFIVKFDTGGNVIWAKQDSTVNGGSGGEGITIDKWDNIYITGSFGDTVFLGSRTLIATKNSNVSIPVQCLPPIPE